MQKKRNILEGKLQPPVGNSDWASFSRKSYCVDKTLLIKELVDRDTSVALFTRPRRFGKTSAMKMLKAFFEKTSEDTSKLFTDKKIWEAGEKYRAMQGKYPVIYLTFKDHKADTWEAASGKLVRDIGSEVARHKAAVMSAWGEDEAKCEQLVRIMKRTATIDEVSEALGLLAEAVHSCHGVKPIILIDEYDMPINSASNRYYEQMVSFMRGFFSGAMKDNDHCEMGIMTGVLRVAKEGILSGLNNPAVWTVFKTPFSEYFGFTEDEVRTMTEYYGVPEKMAEIKKHYDGYEFGGTEIYNPWSVLNYFANDCKPGIYWVNTSSNDVITHLIRNYPHDFAETAKKLLSLEDDDGEMKPAGGKTAERDVGQSVEESKEKVKQAGVLVPMVEELGSYHEVMNSPETLYSLLVSSGYLKVVDQPSDDMCLVRIPNRELVRVFVREIKSKIDASYVGGYRDIERAIINNDMPALQKTITRFLRESVSYFDGAAEGFYHGLTLGLLATLRDFYRIESDTESGDGRLDISLTPREAKYPGFVIEVKASDSETGDLDALAKDALAQITVKEYTTKMLAEYAAKGYTQPLVKIGLAYYKKRVSLIQDDGNLK